ncbi:MAG: DUF3612 domain-containing protein [Pseudomonadales bacterium]|nr:DUF3612 domain-containing protein [Gammaproteobacteria bacterium]NNL57822.1 DUF3612 domain-containing protein [Pseudomonadales bacterium]
MKPSKTVLRNAHFLGTKIRNLRKNNNLTMEDLSARCVKIDPEGAPSVSYLSMIERGKRVPSGHMLGVIAKVFQKDQNWFLDNTADSSSIVPDKSGKGGIQGIALEPGFLFSEENLQIAIPELLSQVGVTGREFAHLLIRAHQEKNQNRFPDLERAAEETGNKQMPMDVDALLAICKHMNLSINWFDQLPAHLLEGSGYPPNTFIRSFFEPPSSINIHKSLQTQPTRLKYDLAAHIGHMVLHATDEVSSMLFASREGNSVDEQSMSAQMHASRNVDAQEILQAWRDFEVSYFAGALLCPRVPFRRLLEQQAHELSVATTLNVTAAVAMRRMTAVSSYPHWHYFDAYPPGKLNAVYRGNGIPLPWGNMRLVQDPCKHWAVFSLLGSPANSSSSQISILDSAHGSRIYACESINVRDLAGKPHVLCAGIDVNPALQAQGLPADDIAAEMKAACLQHGGSRAIPKAPKQALTSVAKILNIGWLERGIEQEAHLICPRRSQCPRNPHCDS